MKLLAQWLFDGLVVRFLWFVTGKVFFEPAWNAIKVRYKVEAPIIAQIYRHAYEYAHGHHSTKSARLCMQGRCQIIPAK